MRGDSLRDLYAKTLALVGLGLLGAVGAAVDYWPSGIQVPVVTAALSGSAALSALPVTDVDVPFNPAVAPARRAVMASTTLVASAAAPVPTLPSPEQLVVASPYDAALGVTVALGAPPAPELFAPSALRALPTMQVALSRPTSALSLGTEGTHTAAVSDNSDDGGFFSDAGSFAKKAGSTIVTGTVKAGAPFVGIVRLIGGAFKKIGLF